VGESQGKSCAVRSLILVLFAIVRAGMPEVISIGLPARTGSGCWISRSYTTVMDDGKEAENRHCVSSISHTAMLCYAVPYHVRLLNTSERHASSSHHRITTAGNDSHLKQPLLVRDHLDRPDLRMTTLLGPSHNPQLDQPLKHAISDHSPLTPKLQTIELL